MGLFSKKRNDDDFLAQQLKEEKIYTEFEKDSYYDIGSCIDTIETPIQSKPENYCNTHNSQSYQSRVNTEKPLMNTFGNNERPRTSSSASQYNNQPDYRKYRYEKTNNVNKKNNSDAKQAALGVAFLCLGVVNVFFFIIGIIIILPLFNKSK